MRLSKIRAAMATYVPRIMETKKETSVLLPLIESAGGIHIFYEKRASGIAQAGEICFPGGNMENGESPLNCALREFTEETGISGNFVKPIGKFDIQFTYSHYCIHTFIAELEEEALSLVRLNPIEVSDFFTIPLSFFLENEPKEYEFPLRVEGKVDDFYEYLELPSHHYDWADATLSFPVWKYGSEVIWGISGRITKRLVAFIKEECL